MNRKRRANGNLYPFTFEDRRRRQNHRGSFRNHGKEFSGLITTAAAESLSRGIPADRSLWERFKDFLRYQFGGSYPGGDRLL